MIPLDRRRPVTTQLRMVECITHISEPHMNLRRNEANDLCSYSEDGILRGHLDKPFGLDALNGSLYNISGSVRYAHSRPFTKD
jgi:hypothetical protein